ncbi:MAG: hypothetical protein FJW31_21615 [Acidobacteria bacterium]|nr:hypothetical protein [Acidobacteriota bacterium]
MLRLAWAAWCLIYLVLCYATLGGTHTYPGDELRFIETSTAFARGPLTLEFLRTYPEMSGPLPFLYFGWWGLLFGTDLATMRTGAAVAAFAALLLLHEWLRSALAAERAAFAIGVYLCLNPYVAAMSVMVYTDMFSLALMYAALLGAARGSMVGMALPLAAALLCRQYLVFLTPALFIHHWQAGRRGMAWAAAASVLPLALLAWLWRGLAPDSGMRPVYLTEHLRYQTTSLVGYVAMLFVYLAPALLWRWRLWLGWPVGAVIYALFPLRPSAPALQHGVTTMGLFDRALHVALPALWMRDLFYGAAFAAGLMVWGKLIPGAVKRRELAALAVFSFLAVMPFSYLYWEKYLLPVLPLAAVALVRALHVADADALAQRP